MGKIKHLDAARKLFQKSPVVTSRDLRLIVRDGSYARLMVSNMIKRGEVRKLAKGVYTIHDDPVLAVFCFKPAYIGLEEALSIHGMWEQETNTVIVTSSKARTGVRNVMGQNVVVHRIAPRYLFGFDLAKYGDFYVPVSDIEKTLIDAAYFGLKLDREVFVNMRRALDMGRLKAYLKPYHKSVKRRVDRALAHQVPV